VRAYPTMTATIRDARPDDIPRLLELYLQLSESSQHPEQEVQPMTERHHAALERIAADPNARVFVLEDGGRMIGTYALYILPNLSHGGRPFAIVENVVIDGTLRGGGYGRFMMDHAVHLAREAGCYKVALTSNNKRAPAHAFYEAIGFERTHKGFTRYLDTGSERGTTA
jgi:GNAT superfamily N-acetyltransferase